MSTEKIMVERYKAIRQELFSQDESFAGEDFSRLVSIKDIDTDLYHVLILLHSNYRAEQQAMRSRHIRITSKIIDAHMDAMLLSKEEQTRALETTKKPTGILTASNVIMVLSAVGIFIFSIAILFIKYPDAAKSAVDVLKLLLPSQGV